MLTIAPNEFTQPDNSVFYNGSGRPQLEDVGFSAAGGTAKETPWFWSVSFQQRDKRAAPHQRYVGDVEPAPATGLQ